MTTASHPTNLCFDAWIQCENLVTSIAEMQSSLSRKVTKIIDECAMICMTTFHALKSSSLHTNKMALLCVGICEECADLCENLPEDRFHECAAICRQCAEAMTLFTLANLN